ncbi:MAG: LacI family DNA-binding transcriptional regulator [Chloroflexota bacterium]
MTRTAARPTITDVARAAGVSVSTVSRVINGKGEVSRQAADAVRRAMAEVGFTASPVARSLVGAQTRLIGLQARNLGDDYVSTILRGVTRAAEDAGYGLLLFGGSADAGNPAADLVRTMPDGLLVISPVLDEEPAAASAGVMAANRAGAGEAVRALVALGHRRIAMIAGTPEFTSSRDRLAGYRDALAEAGIPWDDDLVAPGCNDRDSGLVAARRLLDLPDRPTAIFASNDLEAVGALTAARERAIPVPEALSVIGFDDSPAALHTAPPLATVHQPLAEMGRRAVAMLVDWIAGNPPAEPLLVLPTHLVMRESAGPAPVHAGAADAPALRWQ